MFFTLLYGLKCCDSCIWISCLYCTKIVTMPFNVNLFMTVNVLGVQTGWVESFQVDAVFFGGQFHNADVHCEYDVITDQQWGYIIVY